MTQSKKNATHLTNYKEKAMPPTMMIHGKQIQIPENTNEEQIREIANIDPNRLLVQQNPTGKKYEIYNERKPLPKNKDLNMIDLPRYEQGNNGRLPKQKTLNISALPCYEQGIDDRKQRIMEEVKVISHRSPVQIDEENFDYIAIMKFNLNENFSQPTTTLLIKMPKLYPEVPPTHFFIKKSILCKGANALYYHKDDEFNELSEDGWGKYCLHIKGNCWKPSINILEGDNLITYLELIKTVIDNTK
jgi:hypothetical protein